MQQFPYNINSNTRILLSRNTPIAFIVGVAGFIGSHLAEKFLEKNIQVIGIDDFSTGRKENLKSCTKNNKFHFINDSISSADIDIKLKELKLPRLDYAFFVIDNKSDHNQGHRGLLNFLHFLNNLLKKHGEEEKAAYKTKVALISSIELYDNKKSLKLEHLKETEAKFAKFVKYYSLNGRVVRLAPLYGEGMNFRVDDPIIRLIKSSLEDELQQETLSSDFITRAIYIGDAINLLVKSVLSGSTAHKIYDGALLQPLKVAEIKQILLDPLWYQQKGFSTSELPPWPTPNLQRTMKELSWQPKSDIVENFRKTVTYFKENNININEEIEEVDEKRDELKRWSFASNMEEAGDKAGELNSNIKPTVLKIDGQWIKKGLITFTVVFLIMYGLVLPATQLFIGAFNVRNYLKGASEAVSVGDFNKARFFISQAEFTIGESKRFIDSLAIVKRLGILGSQIDDLDEMISLVEEGVEGVKYTIDGTESLYKTTKVISGEESADPKPLYQAAQTNLTTGSQKINKVRAKLTDMQFIDKFPQQIKDRASDLADKLKFYSEVVEKARTASVVMPEITAVDGKKSYLVLLQNNLELRPAGGFIGSYAKLNFENGRISNINVDDIYNLDGQLSVVIEPPEQLKSDLGVERWFLRDSNLEVDFPTSARQAEYFYHKITGEKVSGVIALDLTASGKLLDALGGVELPEYSEKVDGSNLFEKAITHAEVNFFPGSQAKKNYLTSLQNQLFNKVFYLSNQNWPELIRAIGDSMASKHIMVYLSDSQLFSYLVAENWAGVLPRGAVLMDGQNNDFLAIVESNMGANKVNYYLERKIKLETSLGKEAQVFHRLVINYKNNSPSEVFPGGKYKNRFKIYLPLGTKLTKASYGEAEITSQVKSINDYGRSVYTVLIEVAPKDTKNLILEYSLGNPLTFKDGKAIYKLDIFKQPGIDKDPIDWHLTYPINLETSSTSSGQKPQEVNISTDLSTDRSFVVEFKKR